MRSITGLCSNTHLGEVQLVAFVAGVAARRVGCRAVASGRGGLCPLCPAIPDVDRAGRGDRRLGLGLALLVVPTQSRRDVHLRRGLAWARVGSMCPLQLVRDLAEQVGRGGEAQELREHARQAVLELPLDNGPGETENKQNQHTRGQNDTNILPSMCRGCLLAELTLRVRYRRFLRTQTHVLVSMGRGKAVDVHCKGFGGF